MNRKRTIPDRKQIQYDRQLRLWGDHGQKALENGRVCLIGANVLGTEILKSLVLPGLGSFTIIDHQLVNLADCGSNFFVHPSMIGQSRAKVTCELLSQLNPDVYGNFIDSPSIDDLIDQNTFDFSQFQVVIAANISRKISTRLAAHLWTLKIPLIYARTYGFIGTLRLQVVEHFVIESHPDDTVPDIRLDRPPHSFVDYCNSIDLTSLTREEHLHLPSLVILYKTLEQWQQKNNNRTDIPRLKQEKDQFRTILDQLSEHTAYENEDHHHQLENFQEAKRNIPSRLIETTVPTSIKQLFEDQCCLELSSQTNIFWFIVHAIKIFTENEGKGFLPVRGDLPDMITNTNSYVRLVQIYKQQAKHDCECVHNHLLGILNKYNRILAEKLDLDDLVETYCKNAYFLQVVRTKLMENDDELIDKNQSDMSWFHGLYVCDLFYEEYGRYPGETTQLSDQIDHDHRMVEMDLSDLQQMSRKFLANNPMINEKQPNLLYEQVLEELCRYGASEIHSIAAYLGGCCAQEAIKLITHQYVPINNALFYNGIDQTTNVYKF